MTEVVELLATIAGGLGLGLLLMWVFVPLPDIDGMDD